jgi:cytochrome c oxidase subunit II
MVDTDLVLYGQTVVYTCYALVILAIMGWFGYKISRPGKAQPVKSGIFYTFVGFLAVLGVSLHIITYNTIPWTPMDLDRANIKPDKVFVISVADHKFQLPEEKMVVQIHDKVLFDVTSDDLTYGFGIFRQDNSMVCQMQVIPGHRNDLLWQFEKPGIYSIRSTEYSGPAGYAMIEKDVLEVVDVQE